MQAAGLSRGARSAVKKWPISHIFPAFRTCLKELISRLERLTCCVTRSLIVLHLSGFWKMDWNRPIRILTPRNANCCDGIGSSPRTNEMPANQMLSRLMRFFLIAAIGICALSPLAGRARQESAADSAKLAAAEKEACSKNLLQIYDAIQAYQTDHRDLPNWLSDLVPQYLDDPNVLTCPV